VKHVLAIAAAVGVSVVAVANSNAGQAAGAKTYPVRATMTATQVVTPSNKQWRVPSAAAKAKGTLIATLDTKKRTLTWKLTFSRLGSSRLVVADVHAGKPGRFGPVLLRLCAVCKSGQSGVKKLSADDSFKFLGGNTWMTLITGQYPNGVVRGQIKTTR
jgi:hypothetical protein